MDSVEDSVEKWTEGEIVTCKCMVLPIVDCHSYQLPVQVIRLSAHRSSFHRNTQYFVTRESSFVMNLHFAQCNR